DALASEPQSQGGINAPSERVFAALPASRTAADTALQGLGRTLQDLGYRFTTITPASHARVVARRIARPAALTDIFGWSRPFRPDDLDASVRIWATAAGILEPHGAWQRSSVRFSTLGHQLFAHSAYPTEQA